MHKQIAILGCGPAGLVAAHAAIAADAGTVFVFSKRRKSQLFGAQYLHAPIPDISPGPFVGVWYKLQGSIRGYREKVYGPEYGGSVSPEDLGQNHHAWDIRLTYEKLWMLYSSWVQPAIIDNEWLLVNAGRFDVIISTVPAPVLCHSGSHTFYSQKIWALGDAPENGQAITEDIPANTILCNGNRFPTWYRASNVFGYKTLEWSQRGPKPEAPVAETHKPLYTDCTCWPEVQRLGRYGMWRKGVLVHEVYEGTRRCLGVL
jgi:hypothetical protein